MQLKTIIIDDEPKLREVLKIKLENFCKDINVVATAQDVDSAFKEITAHKPDLIFLDISMPGKTGFDLLNQFPKIDFETIFVTGYNEYALDALKVSAIDYLLKPVKTEGLIKAVEKAKTRIAERQMAERFELLKYNLNHISDQDTKIAIPGVTSYDFVLIKDIIRCEGWQKYTKIFFTNGDCITSSYNLGVYRDMLISYDFFSCHKSHLINKKHIKKYLKEGIIIMSDDSNVPVARRKKEEFISEVMANFTPR